MYIYLYVDIALKIITDKRLRICFVFFICEVKFENMSRGRKHKTHGKLIVILIYVFFSI
jgi:hypothetical protein